MKYSLTLLLAITAILLHAQPGTLDKSYGTANTGTVSVSASFNLLSAAIQPDNKLVLGGTDFIPGKFILLRNNVDGSLDSSFGTGGQAIITINDLLPNITSTSGWAAVTVEPDGKIIAIGVVLYDNTEQDIPFDEDIVVARFLPDGTPDESFGSQGRVVTELGEIEVATAVAVQADGKIVVAGYQINDFNHEGSIILVVRYNTDGSLDSSFGAGNGYVTYTTADREETYAYSLLIQPDNKILVGGKLAATTATILLRYLTDGSLDASFGSGGSVITYFPPSEGAQINSLALDYQGRIAAAVATGSDNEAYVLRYLPNGTLDNSFNKNGQVQLTYNGVSPVQTDVSTILAEPGGKLVVSSTIITGSPSLIVLPVLSGLNEDGSPDSSFGVAGQTISNLPTTDNLLTTVMQSDGKIIIGGNNYNYTTAIDTYLLTRYLGYPVQVSLAVRIKRWLQNHTLSWNGLPADDKIAYYSVEQSANSSKGFTQVAKVSGRSNLRDYSITNSSLLQGMNYYRVKAVSTDGVVRYSEVVSADNTANTASVYPNPAKDYVLVKGLPANTTANISIADGSGTVRVRGVSNGSEQYRSQLTNMQPGTYYVNITTATKTEVLKLVKE